jgi:RNA polymerase sigma-70 factor (ECF subfamily)
MGATARSQQKKQDAKDVIRVKQQRSIEPAQPTACDRQPALPAEQNRAAMFHEHKALLFSIAYRMLGSAADAEDMLQETFIRWQQSSPSEIKSARAYLVTIISRLCIQHLQSARIKREEYVGQWLPEPVFTGDASDPSAPPQIQESLSMAFLLLLEKLTPLERATFLLHEVFDYEYAEVAEILGREEANCRQLLRRARQHITGGRPRFEPSPREHKRLLEGFLDAISSGDLAGLLTLLSDDVALYSDGGGKAGAALNPIHGVDHVARFMFGAITKFVPANVSIRLAEVNGQPSVVYSRPDGGAGCVLTMDIEDERIRNIYVVTNPEKLRRLRSVPS